MPILATVPCQVERTEKPLVLRFTCRAGHVTLEHINKGKPKHLHLTGDAAERIIHWWTAHPHTVAFHCPQCFKGTRNERGASRRIRRA